MSETEIPKQLEEPVGIPASLITAAAEVERLVGTARAAAGEAERFQQAASKSASDTELARTKAAEHLLEVESKRAAAITDGETIRSLATTSARIKSEIEDAAKFASGVRTELEPVVKDVVDLKAQVETSSTKGAEGAAAIAAVLTDLNQKRNDIVPLSEEISALRTKVIEANTATEKALGEAVASGDSAKASAEAAATNCQHVEDGKAYVEAERAKIDKYATDADTKLAETTAAAASAQKSLDSTNAIRDSANESLTEIQKAALATEQIREAAEADQQKTGKLAATAEAVQQRVDQYEAELTRLKRDFAEMYKTIETLLPGAASAGLAAGFHKQKKEYAWPRAWWNLAFFVALLLIAGVGAFEMWHRWGEAAPDYQLLARSLIARLPIVIPLVWVALHAANKSRIASQIKEDYAFKEAVSKSFEGYKKEFASLSQQVVADSPLSALCTSVVEIISASPIRVYDKHPSDPTPMTSLAEAAKELASATKEVKSIVELKIK